MSNKQGIKRMDVDYSPAKDTLSPLEDPAALTLRLIREHGYAHIKRPVSLEAFEALASAIGTIELRTDIKVDAEQLMLQQQARSTGGRPSTYQAGALDFHSDNPLMNVLAWYCIEQDETEGALHLIDTSNIASYFSEAELEVLETIQIKYSQKEADTGKEFFPVEPLLIRAESGFRTYYQPWFLLDHYTEEQMEILAKFSKYLDHVEAVGLITVRLARHECLFINNRRLLHGRNALSENSKRHLLRLYIHSLYL